jgi:isoquinoline 1-oxidoreductase beta subunit
MTEILNKEFSRKSFVKGSGALVVGFSLAGAGLAGKASAATTPSPAGYLPPVNQVDSWFTVHADNTLSFKTSQIELGNGVTTGIAMLIAEELDLSLSQVRHGTWDSWQLVNSGSTGGSTGGSDAGGGSTSTADAGT